MPTYLLNLNKYLFYTLMTLLFISSTSYAEIYKWVDENGKVHYSDKKPDEDKLKVEQFEIKPPPKVMPKNTSPIPSWKQKELEAQQKQQQPQKKIKPEKSAVAKKSKKGWGGDVPETDATRCALARDIISGSAKLRNGSEVDANDKKLAQDEIRRFCN
jgi:hypothetical protein